MMKREIFGVEMILGNTSLSYCIGKREHAKYVSIQKLCDSVCVCVCVCVFEIWYKDLANINVN